MTSESRDKELSMHDKELQSLKATIRSLEQKALEVRRQAHGIQALERNTDRILASIAMLKINLGSAD